MASGDASPSKNCATGTLTMAGTAVDVVCGFRPKHVRIINVTNKSTADWNEYFTDAHYWKTVDSGVGTTDMSEVTSNGVTPLFNGFTIGTDSGINNNNDVVYWTAFK